MCLKLLSDYKLMIIFMRWRIIIILYLYVMFWHFAVFVFCTNSTKKYKLNRYYKSNLNYKNNINNNCVLAIR